jgi:hypothetical protein
MKATFVIILYSVAFLLLSVAGAGLLFLFAVPFSALLLVGLVIWGIVELVRYVLPQPAIDLRGTPLRLGRRFARPAALELRAELASPLWRTRPARQRHHRLQFVPHARKAGFRGRMAALSMRQPHHAHAHSA